jgi:hypothetical protein
MPELLPAPPNLVTTEAPSFGVSPGQIAQPYRELADTFEKASGATEALAETSAKYAGLQAGANAPVNPDGSVQIPKAPIVGPASQVYEQAVKMGVLAKGEGAVKDAARKLMLDHIDDPEGYREATAQLRDTTIKQYANAGAPDVGIALGRAIDSSSTFTYRMLVNQKRSLDLREAWQSIQDGRTSAANDLHVLARGGDTSSPQFVQAWSKYTTLTDHAVTNPALGYSKDKAAFDTDQLHAELQGDVFLHTIDGIYHDPTANDDDGSPKGGAKAALSAAQGILTDPNVKLSPAQRQQLYSKAVAEVHANEAVRRQDIADAREAEVSLLSAMKLGATPDPQEADKVINGYKAAGDQAAALRFSATLARMPLNDDFARQPIPDQLDWVRLHSAGVNPSSSAEARLIHYESGGDATRINGLGYAGLYQFGARLLADLGLYKPGAGENLADWSKTPLEAPGKWSGTFNIPGFENVKTIRDFLANPQAQKAAFDLHTANMDAAIKSNGLDKYIGQTVGGVPITQDGLRAMIHLGGVDGALRTLQSGGRDNPADANHTSLLDYARLGAAGSLGTPSWLLTNRTRAVASEAEAMWKGVEADYNKSHVIPAPAVLNQLVDAARFTGDAFLQDEIADGIQRMQTERGVAQLPVPAQSGAIASLPVGGAAQKEMRERTNAIMAGLDKDPMQVVQNYFGDKFAPLPPLQLDDPQALRDGLAERARRAQFAAQNWQVGTPAALGGADLAQVKGALQNPDPAIKAQIYGAIATLPPDVRGATLKKLGGNDVNSMAEAAAGSLLRSAPDIATSIFRGQQAMKADKKWDPTAEPGGKASFDDDLGKALPASIFPLHARTDPTGPYATMGAMVRARYADLSAQVGDTKYSAERVKQAVEDVTGGVLYHNGGALIAPARGMTQGQFDGVMAGVTDKDLAGVSTLNGAPVTADYLRNSATLQSAGDGRYFVTLGRIAAAPIYAYQYANTEAPQKFMLDLRGRRPAVASPEDSAIPINASPISGPIPPQFRNAFNTDPHMSGRNVRAFQGERLLYPPNDKSGMPSVVGPMNLNPTPISDPEATGYQHQGPRE